MFSRFITPTIALRLILMLSAGLVGPSVTAAQAASSPALPTIMLNVGIHNIQAELAQNEQERTTGLMNRTQMGAHQGMLFVFESAAQQCFWMKNTLLPLSIAFLADDGTIVDIHDMQPQSLASHCSSQPVRLALELNQGWFAKRGIKVGMRMNGAVFHSK